MERRIDGYLVCGGKYHDFDFARLELLQLLAADDHVRVQVAQHFGDVAAITMSDFLVTYTCDLRPSADEQEADPGVGRARWPLARAARHELHPRPAGRRRRRSVQRPAVHPRVGRHARQPVPLASTDRAVHRRPLARRRRGPAGRRHRARSSRDDELYLMEHHGDVVPLLETRWTGTTRGFAEADWLDDEPRLVLYRRPLGDGEVVYFTLGHCRSHWDMIHPPHNGARWPTIDRGSWDVPEYMEILRAGGSRGRRMRRPHRHASARRRRSVSAAHRWRGVCDATQASALAMSRR